MDCCCNGTYFVRVLFKLVEILCLLWGCDVRQHVITLWNFWWSWQGMVDFSPVKLGVWIRSSHISCVFNGWVWGTLFFSIDFLKDSLRVFIIERCHKCDILMSWCVSLSLSERRTLRIQRKTVWMKMCWSIFVLAMFDWMLEHYSGHVSCKTNKGFLWTVWSNTCQKVCLTMHV